MPPADAHAGDTRRTPRALLVLAGVLLLARIALTVWARQQAPADARSPDGFRMLPGPPPAPASPSAPARP
jgi:hypothetical protein